MVKIKNYYLIKFNVIVVFDDRIVYNMIVVIVLLKMNNFNLFLKDQYININYNLDLFQCFKIYIFYFFIDFK